MHCPSKPSVVAVVSAALLGCSVPSRQTAVGPSDGSTVDIPTTLLDSDVLDDRSEALDQSDIRPDQPTANDVATDAQHADAIVTDIPTIDAPRLDAPNVDAPNVDVPNVDVPNVSERNCVDVRARLVAGGVALTDGRYAIDPDGVMGSEMPFVVYCDRMASPAGMQREYLEVDPAHNFVQRWLEGMFCQCQWFRRSFSRLRLVITPMPLSYAIDGRDFTYSSRTVGPQINGTPVTCPGVGPFPEGNYASVCRNAVMGGVTPNNPRANEYGVAGACYGRALGDNPSARVQLVGSGFRVSRFDMANYVLSASRFGEENFLVMSVNNGRGYEAQVGAACAAYLPRTWSDGTHELLDVERDLPVRESLGERCDAPWLLDEGYLGGETQSMNAPAAGLCESVTYGRNVRYYELRIPARSLRDVELSTVDAPLTDVLLRVLDRCGDGACIAESSMQPRGVHRLTVANAGNVERVVTVAVSSKNNGDSYYRITAPRARPM